MYKNKIFEENTLKNKKNKYIKIINQKQKRKKKIKIYT